MKALAHKPLVFKNISELMLALHTAKPVNPLVALVNYDLEKIRHEHKGESFLINF